MIDFEHAQTDASRLLQLLTGAWTTKAVHAMAQIGLADHLSERRQSALRLAQLTDTHPDALNRLLRYLTGLGLLHRVDENSYELTSMGRLMHTEASNSMRALADLYGGPFYQAWGELEYSLRTGEDAFTKVFGTSWFDCVAQQPELLETFQLAMQAGSAVFNAVPDACSFADDDVIADILGGNGALLAAILSTYRDARGVLLEGASALPVARRHLARQGLLHRCSLLAGDCFTQVPAGASTYIMSRVLHDWDDAWCVKALRACHAAMPPTARLIILERLLPDDDSFATALAFDMHMMVANPGGRAHIGAVHRAHSNCRLRHRVRRRTPTGVLRRDDTAQPERRRPNMTSTYLLGSSQKEHARLLLQSDLHRDAAERLFAAIGVTDGWSTTDIGCGPLGCLDTLDALVAPHGTALGIDQDHRMVGWARQSIGARHLTRTSAVYGRGDQTNQPTGTFDLVHARLLVANLPAPEAVVSHMAELAKPGGWVALQDIDSTGWGCEPAHPSWQPLHDGFADVEGIDIYVGRRLPALLRSAGLDSIRTMAQSYVRSPGDAYHTLLIQFAEQFRDRILARGRLTPDQFDHHLSKPETLVFHPLLIQAWGRKPLHGSAVEPRMDGSAVEMPQRPTAS
ncbi:methyltransferase [Kribbella sp. NPDC023855]|uniref:methyltransferase n=1 Tax=Kribbella sp. NPDC023855 TaxID=3154698 RepID=UPI0033D6C661